MCPDGTKYRQGTPDAPDATRRGVWVQDRQEAQDVQYSPGSESQDVT